MSVLRTRVGVENICRYCPYENMSVLKTRVGVENTCLYLESMHTRVSIENTCFQIGCLMDFGKGIGISAG